MARIQMNTIWFLFKQKLFTVVIFFKKKKTWFVLTQKSGILKEPSKHETGK